MNYKFDKNENESENVPVIISEGKYEGIKYNYGSIKFEEEENEGAKLVFDYDILENTTSFDSEALESSEEFHTTIGDILMDILGSEIGRGEDFLREPSTEISNTEE
jgi:GTPase SAR1 family protein